MQTTNNPISDSAKMRALPWALLSAGLNAIFALWTFDSSLFVLFLRQLGLSASRIGVLLSLFPFCGLLALVFAPVAARIGRKRSFLIFYGSRKFVIALLLLLPLVSRHWGVAAGNIFLTTVIVVFAILRAMAETAVYPWRQEYIPDRVRGKFSGWETVVSLVASGVALGVASIVVDKGSGLGRYLALIAGGAALGVVGVALMALVPGGAPFVSTTKAHGHGDNMRQALADGNFIRYLCAFALFTVGTSLLTPFMPLFLCDHVGLRATMVVRFDLVAMICGACASLGLGWVSDRVGSRPVLMPSSALLILVPLCWLTLASAHLSLPIIGVLYITYGTAQYGLILSASRLLYNGVIPPQQNTAYTAVYYAWVGLVAGSARLLGGHILKVFSSPDATVATLIGFKVLFGVALGCFVLSWLCFGSVRRDASHSTRSALRALLKPKTPADR